MKKKIEAPLNVQELCLMYIQNFGYFDKLWRRGEENERYISADHHTDEDKRDYANDGRYPYSVALTAQKINTIMASDKENRTSFKVEAISDPNDEIKAEIAGLRLKNIEARSGLKYIESDVTLSGVGVIYGVTAIRTKLNDAGDTEIYLEEVDYKDFIWDANAKTYEKHDAVFMAEKTRAYRYQIEADYPDIDFNNPGLGDWWNGRSFVEYFISTNLKMEYDLITKFTHYQKVLRDYYCVFFNGEKVAEYRDKADADDILKRLKMPFLLQGLPEPPAFVEKKRKTKMDKYVFTLNDILEYEETELDFFSYSIYQAFQFKDKIWSMTDVLKSNQIFLDRLVAQMDYAFGRDIKDGFEVVVPKLMDGISAEEAVRRAKAGEGVPVMMAGSIKWIDKNSLDPNWITVYSIMMDLGNDLGGGRSFAGLEDSSGESGVAIRQKMMQGEKIASLFIDNKFRSKRDLGTKLVKMVGLYDTAPYIMKVLGGSLSDEMIQVLQQQNLYTPSQFNQGVGYIKMNQQNQLTKMEWLNNAEFELTVTEETLSESRRQQKYLMYLEAEKSDQTLLMSPTWRKMKYEVMDIPFSDRQKLLQEFEMLQEQQRQEAEEQKKIDAESRKDENAKFVLENISKQKEKAVPSKN